MKTGIQMSVLPALKVWEWSCYARSSLIDSSLLVALIRSPESLCKNKMAWAAQRRKRRYLRNT